MSLPDEARTQTLDGVDLLVSRVTHRTVVLLPDQDVEGRCDPAADGLLALRNRLTELELGVVTIDGGTSWWANRGPTPGWFSDTLRPWLGERATVCGLIGVGVGGQGALLNGFQNGRQWAAVAAVAPASDLGRWFGRGTSLDEEFETADAARQAEAPLFFNPLSAPAALLTWCDPRDEACVASATRVISKVQSSGGRITSDLETEAGVNRTDYVRHRASDLAEWIDEALRRAEQRPSLPVLRS